MNVMSSKKAIQDLLITHGEFVNNFKPKSTTNISQAFERKDEILLNALTQTFN